MVLIIRSAVLLLALAPLMAAAQEVFLPKGEKGPVVVVASGASGVYGGYRGVASRVAELGYVTTLIDGNNIFTREQDGAGNLRAAITKAQGGNPEKVVLMGFSRGGAGVLMYGTVMDDLVKFAILYYPSTSWSKEPASLGRRIRVPVLLISGERDGDCCLIGTMREIEAGAKSRARPLELVVYPHADHNFNLVGKNYRHADSEDAWRRVAEALARHHPLK